MVSKPEGFTNSSPMAPSQYVSTKNSSARKPLRQLTETFYFKHMTAVCRFGAAKENRKAIKKAMCCGQKFQSAVVIQK